MTWGCRGLRGEGLSLHGVGGVRLVSGCSDSSLGEARRGERWRDAGGVSERCVLSNVWIGDQLYFHWLLWQVPQHTPLHHHTPQHCHTPQHRHQLNPVLQPHTLFQLRWHIPKFSSHLSPAGDGLSFVMCGSAGVGGGSECGYPQHVTPLACDLK